MTQQQIQLVQESFEQVRRISDDAAAMFYRRLFEIAPGVRPMFRATDLAAQGRKLITMIVAMVSNFTRLEVLIPAIEYMGSRHTECGVTDDQYEIVGEALIWTLKQGLGDKFTPQVEEAWATAYTVLASILKKGAERAALAAA